MIWPPNPTTLHRPVEPDLAAPLDGYCCELSAMTDNAECSCWKAVDDRPITDQVQEGPPAVLRTSCGDCAYRHGSPEREADGGDLPGYTARQPFYCHQGMARQTGLTHPRLPDQVLPWPGQDNYRSYTRGDRTWQADGTPGLLCAGWAAVNAVRPGR